MKYTDPSGELFGIDDAFLIYSLISGAIMGAANASMNGGNAWTGALKGLASSALSTIGTAGIGQLLGHTLGSFGNELLRASLHGANNGLINVINGKNFGTGFITGAMASFAGSGAQALGMNNLGVIASTTGIGGITSSCMGGSFYDGAMTGLNIGMFNHKGKVIRHKDGTLEAVDPLPEFVVRSRHNILLNMIHEKPLETIYPEFGLLLGCRALINYNVNPSLSFSEHFLERSMQRGYSVNDVNEIIKRGERTIGRSKFGELQYRYNYNGNIVIQNIKDKKIVTVFSDMPKTPSSVKGYKKPWK